MYKRRLNLEVGPFYIHSLAPFIEQLVDPIKHGRAGLGLEEVGQHLLDFGSVMEVLPFKDMIESLRGARLGEYGGSAFSLCGSVGWTSLSPLSTTLAYSIKRRGPTVESPPSRPWKVRSAPVPVTKAPPGSSRCGSIAQIPYTDCWKKYENVTNPEELCDKNHGALRSKAESFDRFTGMECYCKSPAVGDGYNCYLDCSEEQTKTMKCAAGLYCNIDKDGQPFCGCPFGMQKSDSGQCTSIPNSCDTCKHFCHSGSNCLNVKNDEEDWLFSCSRCSENLGFNGDGKNCKNIDECQEGTHMCDPRAMCMDKHPLFDNEMKYDCLCPPGWTKNPLAGTKCTPCENNNECEEQPGICGNHAKCEDTEGSHVCTCDEGFEKNADGKCVNIIECEKQPNPCPVFSGCKDTIGSYECICIDGHEMVNGECIPDIEFFCKDCDKNTTDCKLSTTKDSYNCECKKFHTRIDKRSCVPITFCDKADKNNCAPPPRGNCTNNVDGSGFTCSCNDGFEGDGKTCEPTTICERKRPCMLVSNTRCVNDQENPREKYKCVCNEGYTRQVADQDNYTSPCYPITSTIVNNCTLCDQNSEKCVNVTGDKDGHLKTCICRDGYSMGPNGRCIDTNECCIPDGHNCDLGCAECINKVFHIDGAFFTCEVKKGWSGNGTVGTCKDIDECKLENPCPGDARECHNTIGSYKCPCSPGFKAIPGLQDCVNDNECERGNFTCNDYSECVDTIGSYDCECSEGFKESDIDEYGKPICIDINECTEGLYANGTIACPGVQNCLNYKGSYECTCPSGYHSCVNKLSCNCKNINECQDRLDNCDPITTNCNDTDGSFECTCKTGYEKHPEKNNTCVDINECTSTVKPHHCNPNSTCDNVPGSYKCKCDDGYEPEPDSHPMRPFCKRIDHCKEKTDMRDCGICINTDTPPFYRCECLPGSINYNGTMCITPSFCDTDSSKSPEFACPDKSVCKSQQCNCERNYKWIRVEEPLTIEKIKARKGCTPDIWCDKYTCPDNSKCYDTGPAQGECKCNDGFYMDETLKKCIDINECHNSTISCPPKATCHNLMGSYICKCNEGYAQISQEKDVRTNPTCVNINECTLQMDNCTSYPNTKCEDKEPFFTCSCIEGFMRTQTKGECNGTQCEQSPCVNINECEEKKHDCHKNAICTDTPGSYKCKCISGYIGNGKTCTDIDECEYGTDNCDRKVQECINLPGTFNCTCKKGYELDINGKCIDVNECLIPELNNCTTARKERCENIPGSFICKCDKGYLKAMNDTCVDENECLWPDSCPKGRGDKCVNTEGDYDCQCVNGYKKAESCENTPKNCTCVDIPECTDGKTNANGDVVMACGPFAYCTESEGSYDCTCKDGYEGDAFVKCTEIDLCTKFPCDGTAEKCTVINGAPLCLCKDGYVKAAGKCIENPCLKNNGGCGNSSMCTFDSTTGAAKCNCATGLILDDNKNCIPEDVCKCGNATYPCRSEVCDDKELQLCHKIGNKPKCVCDPGFTPVEQTKKCIDDNECATIAPCPPQSNCTNTVGSYICTCPRGQKMVGDKCEIDLKCSNEQFCREDPNASCKKVDENTAHCVCNTGYTGTGLPSDPLCKLIDPCVQKETDTGKAPCTGANEFASVVNQECVCQCNRGFHRNSANPPECVDVNECEEQLFTCNKTYVCKNTVGSYDCVCPPYYTAKTPGSECEKDDKCIPFPCNNVTQSCDWKTGECTCKSNFVMAPNKTCIDRDECKENVYNCKNNTKCVNKFDGYDCVCLDGYKLENENCVLIDYCDDKPCDLNITICKSFVGNYICECKIELGYIQNGPHDCVKNTTDSESCKDCAKNAHCLAGKNGMYNCTCNDGYRGDGRTNCTGINECEEDIDNCNEYADCIDETPGYSCQCKEPYVGDGRNECHLPNLCHTKYNDCPKEAVCIALNKNVSGHWVSCNCTNAGFRFDSVTRQCVDINECAECKEYTGCPCPQGAQCINTEGSFTCNCTSGYDYKPSTNTCDDKNECVTGEFQSKCIVGQGKCVNTPGSWNCTCEAGYKNKEGDDQICEKDYFCGIKDDCDNKTTTCEELAVGFKCNCKDGFLYVPGFKNKCEDRNECKDGSHNCSLDGTELCTNTEGSFACNCTNGFHEDEKTKKCSPDNKCTDEEAKSLNCTVYSICVNLPSKDGTLTPTCICETGYYLTSENICVVVPPCKNDFDCPTNSKCQVVQAQNGTGEIGTYKCECNFGYEMIGHQCSPVQPCKTPGICGKGVCEELLLPPFYMCNCVPGTKQNSSTNKCEPLTCESITCTPNADCKNSPNGGVYCQCKDGFVGIGTISSPCVPVDPCVSATPCSRYATCTSSGSSYNCTCNKGYEGNGTWCININECAKTELNNCDVNAYCTDTQGSYTCTCKEGYTGSGTNGTCININECNDPMLNQCDVQTTNCNDTIGSYSCDCKKGYERADSAYSCTNTNECKNTTICDIHKCIDLPGTYECECNVGYIVDPGSEKKKCIDDNECKAVKPPCHANAICTNTVGSYTCTCKDGYIGDGIEKCEIEDKCKPGLNDCDVKSTKCQMLPDKPQPICTCEDGYKQSPSEYICDDVDECLDENTEYNREEVDCINTDGSYELKCKNLYEVESISADKKNITCKPKDECASDPAYNETMKKIADGQNNGTWKDWMVAPKDNSSGYAICYYNALKGVKFDNINTDKSLAILPFCKNLHPKNISHQLVFDNRLKGFECDCVPPATASVFVWLERQFSYTCPASGCREACRTEYNYECKNTECVCMKGYSERLVDGIAQCIQIECGEGEAVPANIAIGKLPFLSCINNRWSAKQGWQLVRDNATGVVTDIVDIDECTMQPDICCASSANCTGPACIQCVNKEGSYDCTSNSIICSIGNVDKRTCLCTTPQCPRTTAWYYGCSTPAKLDGLGEDKRVCSRILDIVTTKYMTFDNEKALFEFASSYKCDCCFLEEKPSDFTMNPLFNYYGPCVEAGRHMEVTCPPGSTATTDISGVVCSIRAKPGTSPKIRVNQSIKGEMPKDPEMCNVIEGKSVAAYGRNGIEFLAL